MDININHFMQGKYVPLLSEHKKVSCERPLLENELVIALKEMNNRSAPGSDGITIEFLKLSSR